MQIKDSAVHKVRIEPASLGQPDHLNAPPTELAYAPPSTHSLFEEPAPNLKTKDVPGAVTHLLNRSQRRIADAAYDMATSEEQHIEFMHSTFASVGLPRSQFPGRVYERTCGRASLRVEAGSIWNGERWEEQPVPYGPKPRTLLVFLTSYAVRHRTKVIPVGDTFSEFLRMLGAESLTGGERGSRTAYRKQIAALSAATVRLGVPTRNGMENCVAQPIKKFSLWYSQNADGQRPLWPGEITLSDDYYESALERAFPIDARALQALSSSAMAMDMYLWLASRLWRVGEHPVIVPPCTCSSGRTHRLSKTNRRT
jgi:hypothetical protein